MGRILGVDYGTRRVGFAVSDPAGELAFPHSMAECPTETAAAEAVRRAVGETGAVRVVIGLPLNMDGSRGPRADATEALAAGLRQHLAVPVDVWDERLTTVSAERVLVAAGVRRARRREVIDKLAAQIMLQHYLDARPAGGEGGGHGQDAL